MEEEEWKRLGQTKVKFRAWCGDRNCKLRYSVGGVGLECLTEGNRARMRSLVYTRAKQENGSWTRCVHANIICSAFLRTPEWNWIRSMYESCKHINTRAVLQIMKKERDCRKRKDSPMVKLNATLQKQILSLTLQIGFLCLARQIT